MTLNISLSYSRSLNVIQNDTLEQGVYKSPINIPLKLLSVSCTVSEIHT